MSYITISRHTYWSFEQKFDKAVTKSFDTKAAPGSEFRALIIPYGGDMKILARLIRYQLEADTGKWGHCAIYEDQLQRVWPIDVENRKAKIDQFAKEHGFTLSFYKKGLCAIFERRSSPSP